MRSGRHPDRTSGGKLSILKVLHALRFFSLARRLTARGLRVLCYHGISLADEHRYLPKMFMSATTFRQRMRWLAEQGMPVLPLGEALVAMEEDSLPDNAVVITFDDGWDGVYRYALPVLGEYGFKATLYATTYYVGKGTMVFDVALRYLVEKHLAGRATLADLGHGLPARFAMDRCADLEASLQRLRSVADGLDAMARQQLLDGIANQLGADPDAMKAQGLFTLINPGQISMAAADGLDIQLHTHRHRPLDEDGEALVKEIADNRAVLEPLVSHPLNDFCYPSGILNEAMLPVLRSQGVRSAATSRSGFNYRGGDPLLLNRFLDGEHIPRRVFEAELSGVLEFARYLRAR